MKLILALFFGEILAILPFILATNDDGSHSSDQGPASSQNTPENNTAPSWTLSMLDGLNFVHHHDVHFRQNAIVNDRDPRIWNFSANSMRSEIYFQKLRENLMEWNQKLDKFEKEAILEDGQALSKYYAGEITSHQIDQPKQKLDGISLIYRIQNATIGHYFLSEFLKDDGSQHQKYLGTALRKLELNGKILDLERYEEKLQRYKADMEGAEILLQEKFKYYQRKNYPKSDYKYNDHVKTLVDLKNKLQKTRVIWMPDDLQETEQFWTIDQRPVVNQTLWVIRHAQRLDNISKNWFETLDGQDSLARQDVPLSDRGIQQAKELGKWFQYIPVNKVFASPFKRTMQTASGLLRDGEHHYHPQVYINIEPGLTEFFKPCSVKIGFLDKEKLHKEFPLADPNYRPIYSKKALELMAEERKIRPREEMQDCNFVVIHTLRQILKDNKDARHIVLISHSGIISLIHELLTGHWAAVGQTTISKFVRFEEEENLGNEDEHGKNDEDMFRKFRLEYSGDLTHLSDRDYLRPH